MSANTSELLRLARAAIRAADALDALRREQASAGDRFLACDEELREAAIAYRDMLSEHDRRRIGYGESTASIHTRDARRAT